MSQLKPSSHGIVVDHKETGVRYAISDVNYNPTIHSKVRDLKPHESVLSYKPRAKESLQDAVGGQDSAQPAGDAAKSVEDDQRSGTDESRKTTNHTK
ncbi:hypothetical protein SEA_JUANYO_12 [Microbacterium phage Juanyo]|nr:hypothetical protein SEA_JUANYO_12 [Microbacterium phage Juanyo]